MFCIITELKGIENKLVFGSVFRPQISRVLDMGLKGGKTWTRFPNIQIYSNRETEAFISCQQVHTAERGFNLGFATNLLRFLSSFKVHCTKCICCSPLEKMPKIGA